MSVAPAQTADPRVDFEHQLAAIRQRIWLERAGVIVTRGLTLGFFMTLILAVAAWALHHPIPPLWYAVPLLVPLAGSLIAAACVYPSGMTAARIADQRLELSEQLSTAVEIVAEEPEELLAWAQVGGAAQTAAWADQNWRGGPRLGRDLAMAALVGFIAAGVLLLTGPEGRALLGPRAPQPVPEAEPRAVVVPSPPAVAKTEQPPAPSPEAKPQQQQGQGQGQGQGRTAGVQRAVDDIRRSREGGTLDANQAAQRLGQAESELSRQAAQSATDKSALDRLGQAMDQISAGHPAAEALQRGDYERAAQEIANLGTESDQLSQDAKNQLARALREAANDSANSAELSQRERRAADALAGRDYEATRQALADLGDQVGMRGRNVIPQSELSRAWDQVNQERRAQGQPDSPNSARQNQQNQQQQARNQQNQRGQQGQGPQGQQGQSQQPQQGNGNGSAPSQGGPPGETPPDAPAPRLDAQGKPVEVEVKPGQQGSRPGDADKPDDKPLDEVGSMSSSSSASPGQVTSAAPPEINFVPSGRRDVVREYFRNQNQGGGQSGQEGR